MAEPLAILKALADDSRSRVLLLLEAGPLCLCQLTEILELAPSTLSRHLQILAEAGLVQGRKQGRWRYYSWAGRDGSEAARDALRWVSRYRRQCPDADRDARRREEVVRESKVPDAVAGAAEGPGVPEPTRQYAVSAEESLPPRGTDAQGEHR